ncbi:MAG: hypothetical protein EXQ67_08320 [Thermoleophilia bacterium]|nr:hypothetical protein [Thermoleophilia bacterium]
MVSAERYRFVTLAAGRFLHDNEVMRRFVFPVVLALGVLGPTVAQANWRAPSDPSERPDVPAVTIRKDVDANTVILRTWYETWNGRRRAMTIFFPRAAENTGRVLPLLVAAHPAGGASTCVDQMAQLSGRFDFVLACLDGQGVMTRAFSYGAPGQIADLAAAPRLIAGRLPGMKLDARRLYLVGSSMGGTEALLVGLRYPNAYRETVALSPVTDLGFRFNSLPLVRRGQLEAECAGPPMLRGACYVERSPIAFVGRRAVGSTILSVWYSTDDPVSGAPQQVPRFVANARRLIQPDQLRVRVGTGGHGALWDRADYRAAWLIDLGLVPRGGLPATTAFRT